MDQGRSTNQEKPNFNWSNLLWVMLVWLLLASIFRFFSANTRVEKLPYTDFKGMVRQQRVTEITMRGNAIQGILLPSGATAASNTGSDLGSDQMAPFSNADASGKAKFQTVKPDIRDPDLLPLLEKNRVVVKAEIQKRSWVESLIVSLIPWILIIGFFMYFSRRFRGHMGAAGNPFQFAKSKAKRFKATSSQVSFADVAGLENAKKELQEIVAYLKDPSHFQDLGGELPKGLLLVGPPGVGKTLLAQATAGEAGVPFFSTSGSEFIEMFVGVGASRVRDMFANAKKEAAAIIFIDELDSVGRARGAGVGGGHDEREQTLNQILAEMDGFSPQESVVVLSATNRPDVLDPALVRPGRFDRRIVLDLPRQKAREQILKTHTRDKPVDDSVDLANLAARTMGLSGADLKNMVNEAALLAARRDHTKITGEDLEDARDKVLMGIERDEVITDDEKETIAYHEAGHALVAERLPEADPPQKITIIPRGGALGATEQVPEKERYTMKRGYLLDRIAIMLGGRAAEKIKYEDVSTGAGDDLKKATQLARRMICQWGMSKKVGPVTYRQGESHPFLGRELAEEKDYSEHTAQLIDEEIKKIAKTMEQKAHDILIKNRDQLNKLADELLKHETLGREEIERLM
jgi:cell division protease FtsH